MNGFALGLCLKRRLRATQKWAIVSDATVQGLLSCGLCCFCVYFHPNHCFTIFGFVLKR